MQHDPYPIKMLWVNDFLQLLLFFFYFLCVQVLFFLLIFSLEFQKVNCYSICLILMWTPLSDLSTNLGVIFGFAAGSSISSYLFSVRAVTTFSSFMAKL